MDQVVSYHRVAGSHFWSSVMFWDQGTAVLTGETGACTGGYLETALVD